MTVAIILLALILGTGSVLYLLDRIRHNDDTAATDDKQQPADTQPECCGLHMTCEKDSLVAGLDRDLLYYDDEELDMFSGRESSSYSRDEIEMFREVLLTLRLEEIAGWARSITTRGINLPDDVRDELFLIVAEARDKANIKTKGIEV